MRTLNRLLIAAGAATTLAALPSRASAQSVAAKVDRIFAEWERKDSPGCAVGAARDGRLVYSRGYGMANLDYDIPNSPEMVYYVGSVSKQFTAAAIALLSLEGKLSLDDDIRKYVPEMRDYGTPITIRHLVHHTSGVRDIYALMSMRGDRLEDVFPDSAALALIARQQGLAFRPGDDYSYSNSGYFLLAQIVKRVSGKSLREYADEKIFRPLGMTRTHFHDDPGHVMRQRAMSYERDGANDFRISYLQNFDKIGAGGLYSTIGDLLKWDENFYTRRVGGDALQRILHTRGVLNKGDTLPYAFGITLGTRRGLRVEEHGGSMMGYKAYQLRFPDQHFAVLLTCNLGAIDPGPLAHAVADVFLGNRMQPEVARTVAQPARQAGAPATPATFTDTDAAALAGDYDNEDLGVTYRLARGDGGRLMLQAPGRRPTPLVAADSGGFRAGAMSMRFEQNGTARASAFVARVGRIGEMRFVRR